jgi:hypothetical protein
VNRDERFDSDKQQFFSKSGIKETTGDEGGSGTGNGKA